MASLDYLMAQFPEHIADQQHLEEKLHELVWQGDWDEVLRLLDSMPENISHAAANDCAARSIHSAGVGIVSQLLSRLPSEEYTESEDYLVLWPAPNQSSHLRWEITVQGTLVMHAVAEGRAQLLELLLSRGYDVNCASSAAAKALIRDFGENTVSYGEDFIPYHEYSARPESLISFHSWRPHPEQISPVELEGATPLALAVLLGKADMARLLIKRGAWIEAPSVSQSMYLFWREEDENYRAAREEILKTGCRPVLRTLCRCCSPEQLKSVLKRFDYSKSERAAAAKSMLIAYRFQQDLWQDEKKRWDDLCRRLLLLGDAIEAPDVLGELLLNCCDSKICTLEPFIPQLKAKTLNMSCVGSMLFGLHRRENAEKFRLLAENCRLVMDRDAVFSSLPAKNLKLLMNSVSFLPPSAGPGISGLSIAILRTGDVRLIRRALKEGLIPPEESTSELLSCQKELKLPPVCRSLLLTRPNIAVSCGIKKQPFAHTAMYSRWFKDTPPDSGMPLVTEPDSDRWFYPSLRHQFGEAHLEAAGRDWQVHNVFTALCVKGREDIIRRWLEHSRSQLFNTDFLLCAPDQIQLVLTPLCAAALAGQTDTARLLISAGSPAREELWGSPGVFSTNCSSDCAERTPITPMQCALLGRHWDTARLFMEHGATADLSPEFTSLWRTYHGAELPTEEIIRELS